MSAIRILPSHTVNRIAAGEVIERPAAAVKELVENALDAGARRIAVALDGGGIDRIEVTDDGCGMDADGLGLAVLRHATSKLADDDLVRIATLGFRGEALPSIGAAARLAITSRTHGRPPCGGDPGGRRSGFRGDSRRRRRPARVWWCGTCSLPPRHGASSSSTRAPKPSTPKRRFAGWLWPHLAWRFAWSATTAPFSTCRRSIALAGSPPCSAPKPPQPCWRSTATRGALRIAGYACSPAVTRATAAHQALTVNGRPVADPVLKTAVRVAYRDVIAAGRHPLVALWLDLPSDDLDVNVHPAKIELRFRDPAAVRALVIGSIGRALAGGAGTAVPAPRPRSHLRIRAPRRSRTRPNLARDGRGAVADIAASPATRMLAARSHGPSTRWARRWRRCTTPI